ncbi:MAG: 1-(5-phosphoribosyl)-5-[(5-phosphoribosylamino)methylideneamino]imidazole-4-carboxamide isomerase [Bacillota bacterium]|jgi:phosphoribosylformimino-5-aminoimidazole carboxamide ribotide isomerase
MEIFPAIDLRGGQVVRLTQGDYEQMVVYSQDPLQIADQFKAQGAKNLHIVDLDGAKDGRLVNFDTIKNLMAQGGLFVQVGGGIRDEKRICQYLDLGVNRVILGTVAVTDFAFLQLMINKYQEKIAVGVDAKNGFVAINGWKEITDIPALDFCHKLADIGVKTVIYTDIAKDGALSGTNLEVYRSLSNINLNIVASGGISFESEIRELKNMNIYAAIVGKAIYTNTLDLQKIIALANA